MQARAKLTTLPDVSMIEILSHLPAVEIIRISIINSYLYEISERVAEFVVHSILKNHTDSKSIFQNQKRNGRNWKQLLYDITKRRIIISGGKNQIELGPSLPNNNHSFSLISHEFTSLQNLIPPRQDFHLEWLSSGHLYMISNSDSNDEDGLEDIVRIEKYCYIMNHWSDVSPLQHKLRCAATAVLNNEIWVLGGFNMDLRERSNEIYILHCINGLYSWEHSAIKLSRSRSKHAALVFNKELYIAGGYNGDHYYDSVEIYNPASNSWRDGPSLSKVRRQFSLVIANGAMHAIGGDVGREQTIERLDPTLNTWSVIAVVKNCRKFGCVTAHGFKIFMFGGRDYTGKPLSTWDSYDVESDTWASDTPPTPGISAHEHQLLLPREHLFNGQAVVVPGENVTWK